MCTNGSRAARSTPAKARRTGKPSPSNPEGAVVTETTGRSTASAATEDSLGRAIVSAVTAGIGTSHDRCTRNFLAAVNTVGAGFVPGRSASPGEGCAPVGDRLLQFSYHLVVVLLEGRDDLQDQRGPGCTRGVQGGERLVGLDPAAGVALSGERPVVVRGRVGLLQLHDRRAAAEPLQPGVGVPIGTRGAGDALVTDVEAEADRDVLVVARGEQPQHPVHGRRFAGCGEVLDVQLLEPGQPGDGRQPSERGAELALERISAQLVAPVGNAVGADVAAGGPRTGGGCEGDRLPVPALRAGPQLGIGVQEQVRGVDGEPGERRVQLQPGLVARRPDRCRLPLDQRPGRVEVDEVEAVLDQVEAEPVAHDLGPALGLGPALDREAGVDPQPVATHRLLQSCTAGSCRTCSNQAARVSATSVHQAAGRTIRALPTRAPMAAWACGASPTATAASRAAPVAAVSALRRVTGTPRVSALSCARMASRPPPPATRSPRTGPAALSGARVARSAWATPSSTAQASAGRS